jgi:hypothetical protein
MSAVRCASSGSGMYTRFSRRRRSASSRSHGKLVAASTCVCTSAKHGEGDDEGDSSEGDSEGDTVRDTVGYTVRVTQRGRHMRETQWETVYEGVGDTARETQLGGAP